MHDRHLRTTKMALRWLGLTCVLSYGLSGCRHKAVVPPLPAITQPVELVDVPRSSPPPMVEPPQITLPPVPMASGAHPRRERKRRAPNAPASPGAEAEATSSPAATASPETTAIGSLSLGGVANPRAQQEAADLIGSIERRLNSLSAQKAEAEKSQVSRIRNFEHQAQEALNSGDVEGAKTLATKAKLLLDDLEK